MLRAVKRARMPVCVALVLAGGFVRLGALRAAGLNGTAPPDAGSITQLISTLTSNWEWLVATGVGLILMVIAGLMMAGSQRAPDHLFRVIGAILLILVVIPAVLA